MNGTGGNCPDHRVEDSKATDSETSDGAAVEKRYFVCIDNKRTKCYLKNRITLCTLKCAAHGFYHAAVYGNRIGKEEHHAAGIRL